MGNFVKSRIVTSGLICYTDPTNTKSYGGFGAIWNDISGQGKHGTLVGGPTYNVDVPKNNFQMFTGKNVHFGSNFNFTTQDFTISLWVNVNNPVSPVNPGQGGILFYKGSFNVDGYYSQMSMGAPFGVSFQTNQSGAVQGSFSNNVLSVGTWYNITFTRVGSVVKIYINGVDETNVSVSHINPASSANTFTLASYAGGAIDANFKIATFMVYDRAITANEVAQNFNATKARFGY